MGGLRLLVLAAAVVAVAASGSPQPPGPAPPVEVAHSRAVPGHITVIGTVARGVEQGCYLLRTSGRPYLLIGDDPDIRDVGARLIVRGDARPGTPTTCMQGIPLYVTDARPV
ncbi:hypothetical protein [Saccharopolyspora taberi]|uniref:Secreted protein n=1 Tax=Saccharopolyspora taberi TaxID=60895 RepID=A0ABN3VE00_9PSEU